MEECAVLQKALKVCKGNHQPNQDSQLNHDFFKFLAKR